MPVLVKPFAVVFLITCSSGCTQVSPWQRDHLARESMQWGTDPQKVALENHIYFSKEGSSGGNSAAGGGCGCN